MIYGQGQAKLDVKIRRLLDLCDFNLRKQYSLWSLASRGLFLPFYQCFDSLIGPKTSSISRRSHPASLRSSMDPRWFSCASVLVQNTLCSTLAMQMKVWLGIWRRGTHSSCLLSLHERWQSTSWWGWVRWRVLPFLDIPSASGICADQRHHHLSPWKRP